jgi:hypothetical protein
MHNSTVTMTASAWIFMGVVWTIVLTGAALCTCKIVSLKKHSSSDSSEDE